MTDTIQKNGNGSAIHRQSFGKIKDVVEMPNLLEVQISSYESFLQLETPPRRRLQRGLHLAEQVVKVPAFGCRDCGDCSLPDIAYLCPESQCAKNQRNGPCGGTLDGRCEVGDKECIWVRAYDRLKACGEEEGMLHRPVVYRDGSLAGTSAWANTVMERDHHGRARTPGPREQKRKSSQTRERIEG